MFTLLSWRTIDAVACALEEAAHWRQKGCVRCVGMSQCRRVAS